MIYFTRFGTLFAESGIFRKVHAFVRSSFRRMTIRDFSVEVQLLIYHIQHQKRARERERGRKVRENDSE